MKPKQAKKAKKQVKAEQPYVGTITTNAKLGRAMPRWSGIVIPQIQQVRLRYTTSDKITNGAGATAYYQLSQNSLYDPDITSIGAQPEYFDFWTTLYQYYRVTNSKISVTFTNLSTTVYSGHTPYPTANSVQQTKP